MKYTITQLTDNNVDDITAQTSKGNAVWSSSDGNDNEIYFYDGDSTRRLTYNDAFDNIPQISGDNIAWQQTETLLGTLGGSGILFYDGKTERIERLADVPNGLAIPGISGSNVVWGEDIVFGGEVFLYDGEDTSELTDLGVFIPINSGSISGDNVVWTSGLDENFEGFGDIFLYDGEDTTRISDRDLTSALPSVSGDNVAWSAAKVVTGNEPADVYFYDGEGTIQLTDDNIQDAVLGISGDNVVWSSGDGFTESELFFYDGEETIQLTSDETDVFTGGSISGNNVVWSESDGEDTEIFLYDGKTTIQITDNDTDDNLPDIDGNTIVWEGDDGSDTEIFLATLSKTSKTSSSKAYSVSDSEGTYSYRDSVTEENGSTSLFEGSETEDRSQSIVDFNFKQVLADGTGNIYTSSTSNSSMEDSAIADLILPSET